MNSSVHAIAVVSIHPLTDACHDIERNSVAEALCDVNSDTSCQGRRNHTHTHNKTKIKSFVFPLPPSI